jgi:hypothetical protein
MTMSNDNRAGVKTIPERVAELVSAAPPVTSQQREAAVRALARRRPIDNRPAGRAKAGGGNRAA